MHATTNGRVPVLQGSGILALSWRSQDSKDYYCTTTIKWAPRVHYGGHGASRDGRPPTRPRSRTSCSISWRRIFSRSCRSDGTSRYFCFSAPSDAAFKWIKPAQLAAATMWSEQPSFQLVPPLQLSSVTTSPSPATSTRHTRQLDALLSSEWHGMSAFAGFVCTCAAAARAASGSRGWRVR